MSPSARPGEFGSVAIIGGGIIGMSIAWRLAQRGRMVTVYDQGRIGGEASWAAAGMLSPGGEVDRPSLLATLAVDSRRLYPAFIRELEETSGVAIDYQECGALDLAYSETELDALEERGKAQVALGIGSKPITLKQISTFWPRVRTSGLAGARFYHGDAIVNPRDVVSALRAACEQLGVALCENCPVSWIEIFSDGVALRSADNAARFDAAVVAAGAWSSSVPVSGVPDLPATQPVKGHLIGYAQPDQTCNTILRHGHTYLLQRANGLLIAGASVEHHGFDRAIHPEIAASLEEDAAFILPHLAETSPNEVWTGFRPGGDTPHIGLWHSDRLYLAYGHYRNGILLAPVTTEKIAAELTAASWGRR